jgi:hypothetical protein
MIRPKLGDAKSVTGRAKFAWLAKLKHSTRNCNWRFSASEKLFNSDKSTLANPGPRTTLRPALPNFPASVTGSSRRKDERLTHCSTV